VKIHQGSVKLMSIGDRVRPGAYRIYSRFRRAANFCDGERLASLVAPEIGEGPLNLVVERLDPTISHMLRITRDDIYLGAHGIPRRHLPIYDSSLGMTSLRSHVSPAKERISRALNAWTDVLVNIAPRASLAFLLDGRRMALLHPGFQRTFAEHVTHCVDDLYSGDLVRGVSGLKGCGVGLTPSGDDFLAGFLIGLNAVESLHRRDLHAMKRRVYEVARSHNRLSDGMLRLAGDGRVGGKVKKLLGTLSCSANCQNCGPKNDPNRTVEECVKDLCAVGATSGADSATGLLMTLRAGLAGYPPSPPAEGTFHPEALSASRREMVNVARLAGSPRARRSTIGANARGGVSWSS
jgi:hypothetical protein